MTVIVVVTVAVAVFVPTTPSELPGERALNDLGERGVNNVYRPLMSCIVPEPAVIATTTSWIRFEASGPMM